MKHVIIVLFLFMLCGCTKPYVGKDVNMRSPSVCATPSFPTKCHISALKDLIPDVEITKLDDNWNYLIEGTFDPTRGDLKSWGNIRHGQSIFRILFISHSRVFDSKQLNIIGRDLGRKLPFKLKYNSKGIPIEGIAFTYKLRVTG